MSLVYPDFGNPRPWVAKIYQSDMLLAQNRKGRGESDQDR